MISKLHDSMGPVAGREELPHPDRKPHFAYWEGRGLSTMGANCLARYGITEDELNQLSDAQLLRIDNLGRKTLNAIKALGLSREEVSDGLHVEYDFLSSASWGRVCDLLIRDIKSARSQGIAFYAPEGVHGWEPRVTFELDVKGMNWTGDMPDMPLSKVILADPFNKDELRRMAIGLRCTADIIDAHIRGAETHETTP